MRHLVVLLALLLTACGAAPAGSVPPAPVRPDFDLQAHRGGLGLAVESSPLSFGTALDLGVRTLELDVQITADGQPVITHDRRVNPQVCSGGFVGRHVKDLTVEQLRTLDCGSVRKPGHPQQQLSPGSRMMLLDDVFALVRARGAADVRFNIETKVEAGAPAETAPREQFVQVVAAHVRASGMAERVTIQSFDWGALARMREVEPELPLVALTQPAFLRPGSPWLGGLDLDAFGGDPVAAARSIGATVLSPTAEGGFVTRELVDRTHAAGMTVVPWTVDEPAAMEALLDLGVDGLITDYPDRLRTVLAARGAPLPEPHPAR